ncbi:hypothetical protein HXX76_004101 [Chlamydomonas incerta]|uniref:Uncharacterized protein n=1 Tax=Chlamydomonas incerta TaxID=51695 RepID=A0A835TB96_CHLIN|nr:hypothetical protein HXX76_004101 [Chlamydomonas incerta]|eukprot:KAG2439983.1 hypothetical protein HXX76_004101 [Chlamydomonas incerta]
MEQHDARRLRLLCLAASSGDGPSLDAALAHCGCSATSEVLISAAAAGRRAACERLLAEGCVVGADAACAAAEAGHLSLCSLLWSQRSRNCRFDEEVDADADIVRVAEAACFGGHAHVLEWLEDEAGLYDEAGRWGNEHRRQEIDEGLAAAAARGGHLLLMRRQLAKLAAPRHAGRTWGRLLCDVAVGCPLPVFRELAEKWRQLEPPQPGEATAAAGAREDGIALLLHALGSRTPYWQEKVELVLARRPDGPAALATITGDQKAPWLVDFTPFMWASAQPDFEQRLRYLVSENGTGAAAAGAAAVAAAGAGDVGALRFLLDECGVRLSVSCICDAAAGRHAVLEFLRGRGQLPSCSGRNGRTLDPSAAPVRVLAAAAMIPSRPTGPVNLASGLWSRVFERVAREGADFAALRYLHERLGAAVRLRPVAAAGSEEQLEWALGVAAGGAGAAAAQGPAPAAQPLLLAALEGGNLAAASHLHARGLAPVLPAADQVLGLFQNRPLDFMPGAFDAVRWLVEQRRAGAGSAAAVAGAAAVGGAAGEAAAGLADAEWKGLLGEVGLDGRLRGRFSENQVPPNANAVATADTFMLPYTIKREVADMRKKRKRAAAAAAAACAEKSGHTAEAEARAAHERKHERERERVEGVIAVRRLVVAYVEQRFREHVEWEEEMKENAHDGDGAALFYSSDDDYDDAFVGAIANPFF